MAILAIWQHLALNPHTLKDHFLPIFYQFKGGLLRKSAEKVIFKLKKQCFTSKMINFGLGRHLLSS